MKPRHKEPRHSEARMGYRRMPRTTEPRSIQTGGSSRSGTLSMGGRFCGDFTIPRIEMPSLEVFDRDYARVGKPVILTNLFQRTRAAQKWTPDYLVKAVGSRDVILTKLRNHKLCNNNVRYTVPFSDYAAAAFDSDAQAGEYCVQQIELPPEIANDLPTPKLVGSWLRLKPRFWLSTPGHVTETHRDSYHNLLAQVIGQKKLTLFSPIFTHALYSHHPRSPLARYSRINMDRPDLYRFPAARELTPTEITLHAGEALFLPVYWWHRVATLEVSVSVNFWWAPPLGLSLHPQLRPQLPMETPEEIFTAVHTAADLSPFPSEFDVVEYLWSEGFQLIAAAYLYHCMLLLIAARSRTAVAVRHHHGLVRAARALVMSNIVSEDDFQTIWSILRSCRGAVELLGSNHRPAPHHGIADMAPLVTQARRLASRLKCTRHFHPSRWLPERPFGLNRDRNIS